MSFCSLLESLNIVLRMGKNDGFKNELTKKLHDVGTAVIQKTKVSIHENVIGYNEDDYLQEETNMKIQKAELLVYLKKNVSKWLSQFQFWEKFSPAIF